MSRTGPGRRRLPSRHRPAGLTLVELMVALAVGLVIALAAVAALTVARRGFTSVDAASQLRDNGRFAADLIQRVGAQAGYRDVFIVTRPVSEDAAREPNVAGFNNALLDPAAPTTSATARTAGTTGYGSDILVLRYQASQLYTNASDPTRATQSDQTMIDCAGNAPAAVPNPQSADAAQLAQAYGARIVSIFHVALNNGEPSLMCTYSADGNAPWTTVPLVQGVENFQVLYGVDGVTPNAASPSVSPPASAASAPDVPRRYLRADEMAVAGSASETRNNWRRVRSLRIGLVVRTPPGATQDRDAQVFYPFGRAPGSAGGAAGSAFTGDAGTAFSPTPDGRLRQSVTFTVHLRNDQTL